MATSTHHFSSVSSKIDQLEKQVAGLMTTVSLICEKLQLDKWNIPRPDQFVQTGKIGLQEQKATVTTAARQTGQTVPDLAPSRTPEAEFAGASRRDLARLEPYTYSPLNSGASEIRLISILKSKSPEDPIECEISTVSLPESLRHPDIPRFTPLSYTWGGLEKTKTILLNGKSFLVTRNLYVALKHFRNVEKQGQGLFGYPVASFRSQFSKPVSHSWWIDAICINQDDLDERKNQVALMTRLYRMARMAHIWLGEEADDSSRAMELIKKLSDKASEQDQRELYEREPGQTHWFNGPGTAPERIPDEPAPIPDDEKNHNYKAVVQLFKRDWFSRGWILQEVALPQNVTFHCGDQMCSWDQMVRTTSLLVYVADEYKLPDLQRLQLTEGTSLFSIFQKAEQISRLREATRSILLSREPYLSLRTALFYAKNSNTTDPRDKVFAILPLVSPERTRLAADYRQSHLETYRATALDLAATSLDFLSACQYTEGSSKELPSWVPDFARSWQYYPMLMTIKPEAETATSRDPVAVHLPEKSALKVRGYILDTVQHICDVFVNLKSTGDDVEAAKSIWQDFIAKNDTDGPARFKRLVDLRQSGYATYYPLYKTVYTGGKGDYLDLSIRALSRYLVISSSDSDLAENRKLGWYRNFFVGRRFIQTQGRHCGVVPAAAMPGDKVCRFRGSELHFIVRESSPDHWIVIGDSCMFACPRCSRFQFFDWADSNTDFLGNYTDYEITHAMYPRPVLQDMYLI